MSDTLASRRALIRNELLPAACFALFALPLFYAPFDQLDYIWDQVAENKHLKWRCAAIIFASTLAMQVFVSHARRDTVRSLTISVYVFAAFIAFHRIGLPLWFNFPLSLCAPIAGRFLSIAFPLGTEKENKIALAVLATLGFILFSAFAIAIYFQPVVVPRAVGSANLLCVFWACFSVAIGTLLNLPKFGLAIAFLCGSSLIFHGLEHRRTAIASQEPLAKTMTISGSFSEWLKERPNLEKYRAVGEPYPVFLVSAAGGGGYAMAHSYLLLAGLTKRCAVFPEHIFALVGVSGGSVGNALFHANIDKLQRLGASNDCGSHQPVDVGLISSDHLSPVVGTLLFVELPKRLFWLPGNQTDRSSAMGESLATAVSDWHGVSSDGLWRSFLEPGLPEWPQQPSLSGRPALVLVSTDVATGDKFAFMPFNREHLYGQFTARGDSLPPVFQQGNEDLDIRVIDAVVASASFPWVTPTLKFDLGDSGFEYTDEIKLLADGGYFENSGTSTTLDIMRAINAERFEVAENCEPDETGDSFKDYFPTYVEDSFNHAGWVDCMIPYQIINIVLEAEVPNEPSLEQNFTFDPVRTLLNTRSARGFRSTTDLKLELCGLFDCNTGHTHPIEQGLFGSTIWPSDLGLPLGWQMPVDGLRLLEAQLNPDTEACKSSDPPALCEDLEFLMLFFAPNMKSAN